MKVESERVYIQTGNNINYPKETKMYNPDEIGSKIPEWLSDRLRCTGVTDSGDVCIKVSRTNKSREYFLADGIHTINVPFGSVIILNKLGNLSHLTLTQFNILYKEKKPSLIQRILNIFK
jgi:hypothetical protein